jgi:hypothetical protein
MMRMLRSTRRRLFPTWVDSWPEILRKASKCRSLQLGSGLGTPIPGSIFTDLGDTWVRYVGWVSETRVLEGAFVPHGAVR